MEEDSDDGGEGEGEGEGPPLVVRLPVTGLGPVDSGSLETEVCPSPPLLPAAGVSPGGLVIAGPDPRAPVCVVGLLSFLLLWCTVPPTAPPTTAAMTTTAPMMKIAIHFFVLHHGTSLREYGSSISFDANAASA